MQLASTLGSAFEAPIMCCIMHSNTENAEALCTAVPRYHMLHGCICAIWVGSSTTYLHSYGQMKGVDVHQQDCLHQTLRVLSSAARFPLLVASNATTLLPDSTTESWLRCITAHQSAIEIPLDQNHVSLALPTHHVSGMTCGGTHA
jgi:hypothetical protein